MTRGPIRSSSTTLPPLQRRGAARRRSGLPRPLDAAGHDDDAGRRHEHRRARSLARRDDSRRRRARDHDNRRQPREDFFNLVAHDHYVRIPGYRDLTPADESALLNRTSIGSPTPAFRGGGDAPLEKAVTAEWRQADQAGESGCPTSSCSAAAIRALEKFYQIDPKDSWVVAACERTCRSSFPAGRTPHSATCSRRPACRGA